MPSPIVPRSKTNPVGQTSKIRKVVKTYSESLKVVQDALIETVEAWPTVVHNAMQVNAFYEFLVDAATITSLVSRIAQSLKAGGGPEAARAAADASYKEGVGKAAENLSGLLEDTSAWTLMDRLGHNQTLKRATLAGSRAFEQMEGLTEQTATDLGRILFQAIQDGENPKQTAKTIRERIGVSRRRAETIARTEITGAHRRGRWDEARATEERFGEEVRLLHASALIPGRTRRTHARRHGRIFTVEEESAWYAQDGNAINCLCSQTEVVVDENGEPIFGKAVMGRMEKQRGVFLTSTAPKRSEVA